MKIKLYLLMTLMALPSMLMGKNLWTGSQAIDWGTPVTLPASDFADAKAGDRIVLSITFTGGVEWPQVQFSNPDGWVPLTGSTNVQLTEGMTTAEHTILATMLPELQANGLVVNGHGYTLTAIDLEVGEEIDPNAVWTGNVVMPTDWGAWQTIDKENFAATKVGYLLRIRTADLKAGAQVSLRKGDWSGDLADAPMTAASGLFTQFEVTEAMLADLQSLGLIVTGCGYTLTSVEVIDPSTIVTLNSSVPVVNNWVWHAPAKPRISIDIENANDKATTANILLQVFTDKAEAYKEYSTTADLNAGDKKAVTIDFDETPAPGFYRCTMLVNEETVRSFNIGIDPEQVKAANDEQADFDKFWETAKKELAAVPMDAKLTKLDAYSTDKRTVYFVELNSLPDHNGHSSVIRGYYAEPNAEGTYPCIIHFNGYDSGYDPYIPHGDGTEGFAELTISTRGQLVNNRDPYTNEYGDWFVYGFDSPEHYYYRAAYMDAVRTIDFAASREKIQKENIFANGASQGGAFTIAAAALDNRLNCVAPAIPFMGDFPNYFKVGQWPASVAIAKKNELGMSDDDMYRMLSYFDTKNLASRITCPVMMTIGLQDDVCPPRTNMAPYNNLAESVEKSFTVNAELKHETPSTWWNAMIEFFNSHKKTPSTGISSTATESAAASSPIYNINGQRATSSYKGLVIKNNSKQVQ